MLRVCGLRVRVFNFACLCVVVFAVCALHVNINVFGFTYCMFARLWVCVLFFMIVCEVFVYDLCVSFQFIFVHKSMCLCVMFP